MDKNTLKFIIYMLIAVIALYLIYTMWSFDLYKTTTTKLTPTTTTIENFKEKSEITGMQRYNLLVEPSQMEEPSNILEISNSNLKNKFIKQIIIVVIDEIAEYTDDNSNELYKTNIKREIPLDLEIIVTDNNGNEKHVDMNKYKLDNLPPTQLAYPGKTLNLMNLLDKNGELVNGEKITFKSNTYSFKINQLFILGNETGKDYKDLRGEYDILSHLEILNGNVNSIDNKPYLISRIEFVEGTITTEASTVASTGGSSLQNFEGFKIGDRLKRRMEDGKGLVGIKTRMNEGKGIVGKFKEKVVDNIKNKIQENRDNRTEIDRLNTVIKKLENKSNNPLRTTSDPNTTIKSPLVSNVVINTTKIDNNTSSGLSIYEISSSDIENFADNNSNDNIEGFNNQPKDFNSSNIIITKDILNYYYENPIIVMTGLTTVTIQKPDGYIINKVYGKEASSNDIQNFKFIHNIIDFRDSLNPDTIVGNQNLSKKNNLSMDILDVLDYQNKINTELKELDVNKINIGELYKQKLDISATINKIDRISNNYLKLIQNSDEHNAKKFTETIQLLQYLKGELEKQKLNDKVNFEVNLEL